MNILLILLGLVGDAWCIAPIYVFRILNIGNLTGIAVFSVCLVLGLFWKRTKTLIKKMRQKKPLRYIINGIYAFIIMIALLVVVETICMISANTAAPVGDETIVVLGSRVFSYGPSKMTASRLDSAYDYMLNHQDAVCVLSGGQGGDEPWSEALGMKDYLIKKGLDESRIYLEDKSTNTRENLKYSMKVIKENGLNENIAIVSNEFHLYRAGCIAKEAGISYKTIPAPSMLLLLPTYYIRELYAILAQWIL